ncbi:hypothetical protein LTR74_003354 [Friedmanniomyces endolithicus]|nr:hypothetical protein LTR74_003354 [Friedmanniomyces endolithicus]
MNFFRSSPAPVALQVEVVVGQQKDRLIIDHDKVSQTSALIKHAVDQHIKKAGGMFGNKDHQEVLSLDFSDTGRPTWELYLAYASDGKIPCPDTDRKSTLKCLLRCAAFGKRIEDTIFSQQAEAALIACVERVIADMGTERILQPLSDILDVLSCSASSDTVSISICKLLAQYAVIDITEVAKVELDEQKRLVVQAECSLQMKEDQLQRGYALQKQLAEMEGHQEGSRVALMSELSAARRDIAQLESRLTASEKEVAKGAATSKAAAAAYKIEIDSLGKRLRSAPTGRPTAQPSRKSRNQASTRGLAAHALGGDSPSKDAAVNKPKARAKPKKAAIPTLSNSSPPAGTAPKKSAAVKRKAPADADSGASTDVTPKRARVKNSAITPESPPQPKENGAAVNEAVVEGVESALVALGLDVDMSDTAAVPDSSSSAADGGA